MSNERRLNMSEEEARKRMRELINLPKEDLLTQYLFLQQENQELKKQLEEKENIACNWKDSCLENAGEIEKLENQQKEFINYLENEINKIKEQIKNYDIWHEVGTDINFLILKKQFNIEILSKYKEIIGE